MARLVTLFTTIFATVEFYPLLTEYISVIIINLRTKAIISRYNARLLASRPLEHKSIYSTWVPNF